ncbi:hypothetical protein [Nostoc sp. UHCC 0870]|uniref:hypothetical protein n=1 Tax=Nostoc sp. UHCC 0870 TaxID=2914041 RepID=UPI001EDE30AE|nr:hypothetical protein [Nostoc sp. UHCC 0870]UKO99151.1 hypothetical protein L6494_05360 [Nostoc sp. UHCC 0870]
MATIARQFLVCFDFSLATSAFPDVASVFPDVASAFPEVTPVFPDVTSAFPDVTYVFTFSCFAHFVATSTLTLRSSSDVEVINNLTFHGI